MICVNSWRESNGRSRQGRGRTSDKEECSAIEEKKYGDVSKKVTSAKTKHLLVFGE